VINRLKAAMKSKQENRSRRNGEVLKIGDVLISRKLNAMVKGPNDGPKEDHSHFLNKVDTET
jgi:hypothetical protein